MSARVLFFCVFGIGGIALVWAGCGWLPAIGVFVAIWGHNIEYHWPKKGKATK